MTKLLFGHSLLSDILGLLTLIDSSSGLLNILQQSTAGDVWKSRDLGLTQNLDAAKIVKIYQRALYQLHKGDQGGKGKLASTRGQRSEASEQTLYCMETRKNDIEAHEVVPPGKQDMNRQAISSSDQIYTTIYKSFFIDYAEKLVKSMTWRLQLIIDNEGGWVLY